MNSDKDDPFHGLDPKDGFRIEPVETPAVASLHVLARQGGEVVPLFGASPEDATVCVATWESPQPADLGAANRLRLCLDAVCRYLTTGGNWDELNRSMQVMQEVARGGLLYPGYHLLESYSNTEGDYEHIFVRNGSNQAVLWVEDKFIERKTLEQIKREQEDDEWESQAPEDQ